MIDPHTFGGSKASENLAAILNNDHPRLGRKVGAFYHDFSERMCQMMHCWRFFPRGGLLELMELFRDKKIERVKQAKLPTVVESHLLNVMAAQYRTYRRCAKELIEKNAKIVDKKFQIGQWVTVMDDIKDSYGETYIPKGSKVKVQNYHENQTGYEYELTYGFCVGKDALMRI
jgi:hypothetical protein